MNKLRLSILVLLFIANVLLVGVANPLLVKSGYALYTIVISVSVFWINLFVLGKLIRSYENNN